jgi:hypothetical protein
MRIVSHPKKPFTPPPPKANPAPFIQLSPKPQVGDGR